jgi:hypothetical protein
MPAISIMNQAKGPLPFSKKFSSPLDGPVCLVLSGSVWSQKADQLIGFTVELDGVPVGSAAIFSNLQSTHRAVVPSYIPITITFGDHILALLPTNAETTSDYNDFFDIALIY